MSLDQDEVTVDFDRLCNTADVGIKRAFLFMGLGVNCANDPTQCDFSLPEARHLRIVSEAVPEAKMREYKEEFGVWIVSNGLRELIDTFNVFLDQLYSFALTVEDWSTRRCGGASAGKAALSKRGGGFARCGAKGEKGKLARLEHEFGISTEFRPDVETISRARDCLTHRLGIVGRKDVGTEGCLTLRWRVVELVGHRPNGSVFVAPLDKLPVTFPQGSGIGIRMRPLETRVPLGDRLRLSAGELKHVCFLFSLAVDDLSRSALAYASRMGVEVSEAGT